MNRAFCVGLAMTLCMAGGGVLDQAVEARTSVADSIPNLSVGRLGSDSTAGHFPLIDSLGRKDSIQTSVPVRPAFKIGHVRTMELANRLPQMDSVIRVLQDYGRELAGNLKAMTLEYNKKYAEFQAGEASWSELVKENKERELEELWKRLQDFERQSKADYAKRSEALIKPLTEKVKSAIDSVAAEGGFAYILDASNGMLFLGPAAPLVEVKLGLPVLPLPAKSVSDEKKTYLKTQK